MKSTVILCLSPFQCDSVCVGCVCVVITIVTTLVAAVVSAKSCTRNYFNLPSWCLSNNYAIQNDAMISLNVPNKYFVIDSRVNKRTSSYCHMADAGHGDGYGNGAALVALMVHKFHIKCPMNNSCATYTKSK